LKIILCVYGEITEYTVNSNISTKLKILIYAKNRIAFYSALLNGMRNSWGHIRTSPFDVDAEQIYAWGVVGPRKIFHTKVRFLRIQAKETRAVLDARLHLLICREETDRSIELFNSCVRAGTSLLHDGIRNCKRSVGKNP